MATVSMEQVKELRERTQAGLNDCRSALVEAEGNIEKAVEIILKKGLAKSAKRAGAVATEGEVAARVADDLQSGVIVEVNIQTDFAARNEDFRAFVQKVLEAAVRAPEGADLGKEPDTAGSGTIEDARQALVGRLGENIAVRRWARVSLDGPGRVHSYVHMGGKIGVLLAVATESAQASSAPEVEKLVDDTAMHIAAMGPQYLSSDEVSDSAKAKQAEIFEAQLKEQDKPPPQAAWPKVVEGKVKKWLKEVCLLDQPSVVDSDKTVDEVRALAAKPWAAASRSSASSGSNAAKASSRRNRPTSRPRSRA